MNGVAEQVMAWRGKAGLVGPDQTSHGMARMARQTRHGRQGLAWKGEIWQGRHGKTKLGVARQGITRQARTGLEGRDMARNAGLGGNWHGWNYRSGDKHGRRGEVW